MQRTVKDKVPKVKRGRPAADLGRYAKHSLDSTVAAPAFPHRYFRDEGETSADTAKWERLERSGAPR